GRGWTPPARRTPTVRPGTRAGRSPVHPPASELRYPPGPRGPWPGRRIPQRRDGGPRMRRARDAPGATLGSQRRPGGIPMEFDFGPKVEDLRRRLLAFMDERVYPAEAVFAEQLGAAGDPHADVPVMEGLKAEARAR